METMSYEPTPDADPVHVYRDAPVGIRPERFLNNGQPSFVGRLIDELELHAGDSVAHVGAGSGYFTAVLAATVGPSGRVAAVELDEELAARAQESLLAWSHATVVNADGCEHHFGEVDAMLINAGASAPRPLWLDSLRPGGRLVMPLVRWPTREEERGASGIGIVVKIVRGDEEYAARVIDPVVIFPCIGGIDATADRNLAEALRRPEQAEAVRTLRRDRHDREATCWLHGEGYCFSLGST
jgi:protein-L-isoaspartate(D-aspartate) O-methyltransferase